jgi:Fur family ferric uptake transcriptional regulator
MRWTPRRRAVIEVLQEADGHLTAAELVERCRFRDPNTIPSTVYRTLDVLEELGLVRHGHGADGREEYHVGPGAAHGHMYCATCGASWAIPERTADRIARALREAEDFEVDRSHVTVVGRCGGCATATA